MKHHTEHRVMLCSDIEDYTSRNRGEQATLQRDLVRALDHAGGLARLGLLDWRRQEQGDGQFVVLPQGVQPIAVLRVFVAELGEVLAGYNTLASRMRLRLSIHEGPILLDGANGVPGAHAVQTNRLVNAAALKAAMRARPGANLGVIVSDRIFEDYVGQSDAGPSKDDFRRVEVAEKKERYVAHIHLPGHNVHALGDLTDPGAPDPEPGTPAEGSGGTSIAAGRDLAMNDMFKVKGGGTVQIAQGDISKGPVRRKGQPR
ncbi:hypothetical protein [Streptosporangium roseum]|uniref:Guanylate cyclase domain-containing protein n=1 Tax=Streptosporangium roseum (strain ATCC 12428 / DSM 43021 / JCM 3005 / KCTC 9067 / NCIMB 10171 / NRRL 2505 / NI 9100) TaxID=479432 RepID=D2B764_STRRD|nr:hypothetical protein [Streptosporangium roseum]ACZ89589.1 hypothetical protein Sros_6886 [Streptosporangium roseum DSM 43021]